MRCCFFTSPLTSPLTLPLISLSSPVLPQSAAHPLASSPLATYPHPAQVERIAEFLKVPLSRAKLDAVSHAASFGAMKAAGGLAAVTLRQGGIGDWRNHMRAPEWARFDAAFDASLDGVALAEPLRFHQMSQIGGLPTPRRCAAASSRTY